MGDTTYGVNRVQEEEYVWKLFSVWAFKKLTDGQGIRLTCKDLLPYKLATAKHFTENSEGLYMLFPVWRDVRVLLVMVI